MAEYKPPANAAGQTPAPQAQDPLAALLNPNSGAPSALPRTPKTISLLPNVTNARLYTCSRYPPGPVHEMRAIDPRDEQRRREFGNNLGIMLLGPVFGAPAAIGRLAGAPEPVIESLGQLGLDAASVAGVPGARGGGRVIEPVPIKPVPTQVVRVVPRNTGVFVLKPPPKINRQKQNGHISDTPQHKNRKKANKPTSTFDGNVDADKLTQEAWKNGQPVPGRPGVREYDFGYQIGTAPNGSPQSTVRVHMDSSGTIHGHPSGTMRP